MPLTYGRDQRIGLLRTELSRSDGCQLHLTQRSAAFANIARPISELGIGFCVTGLAILEFPIRISSDGRDPWPCSEFPLAAFLGFLSWRTGGPVGTTASTSFSRLHRCMPFLESNSRFQTPAQVDPTSEKCLLPTLFTGLRSARNSRIRRKAILCILPNRSSGRFLLEVGQVGPSCF